MTRKEKKLTWIFEVALTIGGIVVVLLVHSRSSPLKPILLTGAVVREDTDTQKQTPLPNTAITVTGGAFSAHAVSDPSGLFTVPVQPGLTLGRTLTLKFEHAGYKPVEMEERSGEHLYVVRMEPLVDDNVTVSDVSTNRRPAVKIKNLRVRYSYKEQSTIVVGLLAKQFEVVNTGNVPCRGQRPCSPDGKWKAAEGSLSVDAPAGDEFRNVRISCVAGPCPFTRLEPAEIPRPVRTIRVSALNWSDTAHFLVEADVIRTMATDAVHQSFPFVDGDTMTFALPAAAEGPSILADIDNQEIVYPLGPRVILSWATCGVEAPPGKNKVFRCEIKPGYELQR